jgi:outer membrane protein OmpA-like peptidoglycan-associated protein/tetratricopeptide (TPR) repeat protein
LAKTGMPQSVAFDKSLFPNKEKEFKSAKQSLDKGYSLMSEGESSYKIALEFLEQAQSFNPNNAKLNLNIGICLLKTNRQFDALNYFEKAKKLESSVDSRIDFYVGKGQQLNSDFSSAILSYENYKTKLSKEDVEKLAETNKLLAECRNGIELSKNQVKVEIENLGPAINSESGDYIPLLSADTLRLFFTSRRSATKGGGRDEYDGNFFEDVYSSIYQSNAWQYALNMGAPINTELHDAAVGVSVDGHSLILFRGFEGNGDLFISANDGFNWSEPIAFPQGINSNFHESSACFAPDGRTLYFVSDREGGVGGRDIYKSTLTDGSLKWSEPVNLGNSINTIYDEEGVFMHPDGKTLYFSTKGHNTIGGYDIFKSMLLENKTWSEPINLGVPLNTPGDEIFYQLSADGSTGYMSSYRKDGLGDKDIYRVKFSNSKETPTNLVLLKGVVTDAETGNPLKAQIEVVDLDSNLIIGRFNNDYKTGEYLISLPNGKNYGTVIYSNGYLFESFNFDLSDTTGYSEVRRDIKLKEVKAGNEITLNNIFFKTGSVELAETSINELNRLKKLMETYPNLKVELAGHCDNIGTEAYNNVLSQKRADTVKDYLVKQNFNPDRLVAKGYGYFRPKATNETPEGRALNRRIEMMILSK